MAKKATDMGTSKAFTNEILVMGVLLSDSSQEASIHGVLSEAFGPIETVTEREEFRWTDYYEKEMGGKIQRYYLAFHDPVDPSRLAAIKQATNEIEKRFAVEGRRRVNLDPGLLAPGRFVLATTKDRAHRIPLSGGIYAELTLIYEKGAFHPLAWTYPDWASDPVRNMLALWRKRLFILNRT